MSTDAQPTSRMQQRIDWNMRVRRAAAVYPELVMRQTRHVPEYNCTKCRLPGLIYSLQLGLCWKCLAIRLGRLRRK